jgi:DNA-3-methyladenine glycosylase II
VSRGDPFQTLARSIVGQQISVRAAQVVWERVRTALVEVTPRAALEAGAARLFACGLSRRKVEYVLDLAAHFATGRVEPPRWVAMDDEQIIAELVDVRGVGRWTAEMFLIFNLLRPNVLPVDDLGLQRAVSLSYRRGRLVSETALRRIANAWQPWRSVATWYLWRSLDPVPVEY